MRRHLVALFLFYLSHLFLFAGADSVDLIPDPVPLENNTVHHEAKTVKKELDSQISVNKNITEPNAPLFPFIPSIPPPIEKNNTSPSNETTSADKNVSPNVVAPVEPPKDDMGPNKRGVIVFGSLTLFAFLYFVYKIYRKKKYVRDEMDFELDNQQFKYGMLLSNDGGDGNEMSNVPLTIDSDDEDEMEIFDLEGRNQRHFDSARSREPEARNRLLAKEDVEILDLDLPGVRSASRPVNSSSNDEDLLNLDDAIDEILSKPQSQDGKPKTSNDDNFFNVL